MQNSAPVRRSWKAGLLLAVGALLLAACSNATHSAAAPTTHRSSGPLKGGVVTFAEIAADTPNYIFPFMGSTYDSGANTNQFQYLMYGPLYSFQNGAYATLNTTLSLATPPVYKDGRTVAVVNLKHERWSDGEPVDASDVMFWMNMLKAEQENWTAFVPGDFPDNLTNVVATGKYQVTFYLNKAYNPTWFTYNELSQITPMPEAWDITKASGAPGSGGCAAATYSSVTYNPKTYAPISDAAKACNAVYDFLSIESGYNPTNPSASDTSALGTYATNPIWQVVDGPWRLSSFSSDGKAVLVPNEKYSGKKPYISKLVELPFTSDTAEYDALVAGAVDVGYLPFSEITAPAPSPGSAGGNNSSLASKYTLVTGSTWSINYLAINFHSNGDHGVAGKIISQLYFRQALQTMVDQRAYLLRIYKNYGVPTYGPVPLDPSTWASPGEKDNPYPYNPSKAALLLKSHGWHVVPDGVSTCRRPGTGPSECGAGIPAGAALSFNLQYASGSAALTELMDDEASSWSQLGVKVALSEASVGTVITNAAPCASSCPWEMQIWASGGGWGFQPDYYPTGGEIFASGASSNFGSYDSPANNANIVATHTAASESAFYTYENFLTRNLPVIWEPNSLSVSEVVHNLHIGPLNPLGGITPEDWYFTRT